MMLLSDENICECVHLYHKSIVVYSWGPRLDGVVAIKCGGVTAANADVVSGVWSAGCGADMLGGLAGKR